jgi:hypothetical protein
LAEVPQNCAHCGARLKKWRVPDEATWSEELFYVCFSDDCSYYKSGWEWMKKQYNHHVSYRFAVNPSGGATLMIPVWSDSATREMIEEDDKGGEE